MDPTEHEDDVGSWIEMDPDSMLSMDTVLSSYWLLDCRESALLPCRARAAPTAVAGRALWELDTDEVDPRALLEPGGKLRLRGAG